MARRTIELVVSDLSGTDLGDDAQTINFSIGCDQYVIDLSGKEAEKFYDALKKYTDAATKVAGRGVRKSTGRAGGSGRSKEELAAIREWLKANGHEVSDRGRIKQDLIDLYDGAN